MATLCRPVLTEPAGSAWFNGIPIAVDDLANAAFLKEMMPPVALLPPPPQRRCVLSLILYDARHWFLSIRFWYARSIVLMFLAESARSVTMSLFIRAAFTLSQSSLRAATMASA